MASTTMGLSEEVQTYVRDVGIREPRVLAGLREETAPLPESRMQVAPEQGALLAMLVRLTGARRCIELGTFTGYSSTAVALALPADGRLLCCDVSEDWTSIARRAWREAGVDDKIELRLAPALETLADLVRDGEAGTFDFAFVDAVKEEYADYHERLLELLRPGGLIAYDNVLWGGAVADPDANDARTRAIRAFNEALHDDPRLDLVMIPIADGLTLACKR